MSEFFSLGKGKFSWLWDIAINWIYYTFILIKVVWGFFPCKWYVRNKVQLVSRSSFLMCRSNVEIKPLQSPHSTNCITWFERFVPVQPLSLQCLCSPAVVGDIQECVLSPGSLNHPRPVLWHNFPCISAVVGLVLEEWVLLCAVGMWLLSGLVGVFSALQSFNCASLLGCL